MSGSRSRPPSLLAIGLAAVVLAACGSSSKSNTAAPAAAPSTPTTAPAAGAGYTAAARQSFVTSCSQRTPAGACECMFAYLKAHVTYDKLKADVTKNTTQSQYLLAAAHACKK